MRKLTTLDFVEKSEKIHNKNYDYSLVEYLNNRTKVKIICYLHGVFEQTPNNHLLGKGCLLCGNKKIGEKLKKTNYDFIKKCKETHNDKYDYSLVEYKNANSIINIICPIHGIFKQKANNHLNLKHGCSLCSENKKHDIQTFIKKCKETHNDKYDYSLVEYKNANTKVKIICNEHDIFEQTPNAHINQKQGCPYCKTSKGEGVIKEILNKNNVKYVQQHKFIGCKYKKLLPFDFYLPDYNMCIEYDGIQHFNPISKFGGDNALKLTIIKDNIKTNYCLENKIKLLRVKYNITLNNLEDLIIGGIRNS